MARKKSRGGIFGLLFKLVAVVLGLFFIFLALYALYGLAAGFFYWAGTGFQQKGPGCLSDFTLGCFSTDLVNMGWPAFFPI